MVIAVIGISGKSSFVNDKSNVESTPPLKATLRLDCEFSFV